MSPQSVPADVSAVRSGREQLHTPDPAELARLEDFNDDIKRTTLIEYVNRHPGNLAGAYKEFLERMRQPGSNIAGPKIRGILLARHFLGQSPPSGDSSAIVRTHQND